MFTQDDAKNLVKLVAAGNDAQAQFAVSGLRARFQARITDLEQRKAFVYLLARFGKSFHFLTCFFAYAPPIGEFAVFAEYIGPQLIKQGSVSELMKQIRQTEVVKAAVKYQGEVHSAGTVKLKPSKGTKTAGPPTKKVSVQDMVAWSTTTGEHPGHRIPPFQPPAKSPCRSRPPASLILLLSRIMPSCRQPSSRQPWKSSRNVLLGRTASLSCPSCSARTSWTSTRLTAPYVASWKTPGWSTPLQTSTSKNCGVK